MKKLLYITAKFPHGRGEEFLRHEIPFLQKRNKIILFPIKSCFSYIKLAPNFSILHLIEILTKRKKKLLIILKIILSKKYKSIRVYNFCCLIAGIFFFCCLKYQPKKIRFIYCEWASTTSTVGYFLSILLETPFGFCCHRGDLLQKNLLKEKIKRAKFVRCISEKSKKMLLLFSKSNSNNIFVIYKGVFMPKNKIPKFTNREKVAIFSVGSLDKIKGHLSFLENIKSFLLKNRFASYYLFGTGNEKHKIKIFLKENNLEEQVFLKGYRKPQSLVSWILNSPHFKIYAHPSLSFKNHQHEGIPTSILESMAFGIPVISTNSGGTCEIWGKSNYEFCKKPSKRYFEDSLKRICSMRPSDLRFLCQKNKAIILKKFNAKTQCLKLEKLIRK